MTLDHHDEATAQAMRVVARQVIALAVSHFTADPRDWADVHLHYEHIDEFDWADVGRVVSQLAPGPGPQEYRAAYDHLAARTETP